MNFRYLSIQVVFIVLILMFFISTLFADSVTICWDAPTTNADETPVTDLAGYKIYYGTSPNNYTTIIDVGCSICPATCPNGGGTCTYVIEDISNRTYFVVTAYDTNNNESDYSNEVPKNGTKIDTNSPNLQIGIGSGNITLSY